MNRSGLLCWAESDAIGACAKHHFPGTQVNNHQSMQRASSEHAKSIIRACAEHHMSMRRASYEHAQSIIWACAEHHMSMRRASYEHAQMQIASYEHAQSIIWACAKYNFPGPKITHYLSMSSESSKHAQSIVFQTLRSCIIWACADHHRSMHTLHRASHEHEKCIVLQAHR
jgi:hypothetical protein